MLKEDFNKLKFDAVQVWANQNCIASQPFVSVHKMHPDMKRKWNIWFNDFQVKGILPEFLCERKRPSKKRFYARMNQTIDFDETISILPLFFMHHADRLQTTTKNLGPLPILMLPFTQIDIVFTNVDVWDSPLPFFLDVAFVMDREQRRALSHNPFSYLSYSLETNDTISSRSLIFFFKMIVDDPVLMANAFPLFFSYSFWNPKIQKYEMLFSRVPVFLNSQTCSLQRFENVLFEKMKNLSMEEFADMKIIHEKIENASEFAIVKKMNCYQGFFN
jgi:hypothetical protein